MLGDMLDFSGGGRRETPWETALSVPGFVLRRYGRASGGDPPVLIVPAPIKGPYIFDILPEVSVVRRLLDAGFPVYLLAWRDMGGNVQTAGEGVGGLGDFAGSWIDAAVGAVEAESGHRPVLIGHSLGGTLAAIFTSMAPYRVLKLVLILAPLRFAEEAGALAAVVMTAPPAELMTQQLMADDMRSRLGVQGVPGSFLDLVSVAAAPDEFVIDRWLDAVASLHSPDTLAVHQAVMRWTLDELAMPDVLFCEIVELLYRRDLFARGALRLRGAPAHPQALARLPVVAVVDPASRLVPPISALAPLCGVRNCVLHYEHEVGVGLAHVGPLVGRNAHAKLWPELIAWMRRKPVEMRTRNGS